MKMIKKVIVSSNNVISNNIPDDGIAAYDSQASYVQGDTALVTSERNIYEALTSVSGIDPVTGSRNSPREWRKLRTANDWAMFDGMPGTLSESGEPFTHRTGQGIEVEIDPGKAIDMVALMQVEASEATLDLVDTDGITILYSETLDGSGFSNIDNWHGWFFDPISKLSTIIFRDLPQYPNATVRLSIVGSPAKCGILVMGDIFEMGESQYGATVGIRDYSVKETDEFGNPIILERGFSDRGNFDVVMPSASTTIVKNTLAEYRTTPTLWIGSDVHNCTLIYGFYIDFEIIIANFAFSECAIEIEGITKNG